MSRGDRGFAVLLLVAIGSGAAREFLFLNLNYAIDHLANHRVVSYAHSAFRAAVDGFSLHDLIRLKWALAFLFIGANLALSILLARILFGDHRYRTLLVVGFVIVGGIALILNFVPSETTALGDVAVKLLHVLQYPVVLIFIWAASRLAIRSSDATPAG